MRISKREERLLLCLYWIVCILIFAAKGSHASETATAYRLMNEYTVDGSKRVSFATCFPTGKHELLTAAHAVQGADCVYVEQEQGWIRCRVVKSDAKCDLALLECKYAEFKPLKINAINAVVDTAIQIYGSPGGQAIRAFAGKLCRFWTYADNHDKAFICTAVCRAGCSGAPVVANNKVVGVMRATDQADGAAVCIPCEKVTAFLCDEPIVIEESKRAEVVELPKVPKPEYAQTVKKFAANGIDWPGGMQPAPLTCQGNSCSKCQRDGGACPGGGCASGTTHNGRHRVWDSDGDGHGQGCWTWQ